MKVKNKYDPVSVNDIDEVSSKNSSKHSRTICYTLSFAALFLSVAALIFMVHSYGLTITMTSGNNVGQLSAAAVPLTRNEAKERIKQRKPSINEMAEHVRQIFMDVDFNGDKRLNLQEFTYFISVSGAVADIFVFLGRETADSLSVTDMANIFEAQCTDTTTGSTEACESHLSAPQCHGFDSWRKCLEFMALEMVATITGDENAELFTRQQYTEYAARRAFVDIAGDNEFVEFVEFKRYQEQYVLPFAESFIESHPIEDSYGFQMSSKPLVSSKDDFDGYKKKVLANRQRKLAKKKRQLMTKAECCDRYDCDRGDVESCKLYGIVCVAACAVSCATDFCTACSCLAGLGFGWCNEAWHCVKDCGCVVEEECYWNCAYILDCGSESECPTDFM